ncbi:hypothetical protein ACHAXR_004761 [Thalassiosira sp. AJA248-18]
MENGCVCCNLAGDLVEQMTALAKQTSPKFDYMIIEASGVSEPAAIAALFETCEEDHDHSGHEKEDDLPNFAKLDTLVTVVDSCQFFQNIGPDAQMDKGRLLLDQVEYSNVVLLNKTDLVSEEQLNKVRDHVMALNSKAKVISCKESSVDVKEVVNTGLFKAEDFDLDKFTETFEGEKPKSCCKASASRGESPCCLRARTIESGLSKVLLPQKKTAKSRHNENYQISSFVYKARRPFNPAKIHVDFLDPFFVSVDEDGDEEEGDEEKGENEDGEEKKLDEEDQMDEDNASNDKIKQLQEEAVKKAKHRSDTFGNLLRMKGFMWKASSHDIMGFVSIAGSMVRLDAPGTWTALESKAYTGSDVEKAKLRKDWDGDWKDRRQELVFIGQSLKHDEIQKILDSCLLSDEEMAMGVDGWKATFGDIFLHAEE